MRKERRNPLDITPGLMFSFVPDKNPLPKTMPLWVDADCVPGVWTVIGKRYCQKMSGGYWEFLCLGPGPTLDWYGMSRWIVRIVDPKYGDRDAGSEELDEDV